MMGSLRTLVNTWSGVIRVGSVFVLLAALLAILQSIPLSEIRGPLADWVNSLGWAGPLIFGLIYFLAAVLLLPASVFTVLAGGIFGLATGFAIVIIAATLAAAVSLLLARTLLRGRIEKLAQRSPRFAAIDQAIRDGGWRIVALLRLSPVVPFGLQNYFYGLTSIRFWPCVLTSAVTIVPGTFLYVYLGTIAGVALDPNRSRTTAEWALLIVGLFATLAATWFITKLAQARLAQLTVWSIAEGRLRSESEPQPHDGWPWATLGLALLATVAMSIAVAIRLV
jgi:uncharacterized membrane protein YdjX (TVP38/TMEM64 family)